MAFRSAGPCGPCGGVTPSIFGGPGSGLWPSGRARAASSSPASPTCVIASIFADCFADCEGVISTGSPGPVCGWSFIAPFGGTGGTITFVPGSMTFNTFVATDYPVDAKPLPSSLASVLNISGQFSFTEFPSPPTANTAYGFVLNNAGLTETLVITFFGDGSIGISVGDPSAADLYFGTWIPNNGTHEVAFTVDALGVPTLFVDGVAIPLVFIANVPSFGGSYPADSISLSAGSDAATPVSSVFTSAFITAGVVSQTTEFCCP